MTGKLTNIIKNHIFEIFLFFFCLAVLAVAIRMNLFRYNNFDFGKFDLGNMTQMVWYTLNGRFLYLTDYFGTNLPRWAMSHVDPILLLFVPLFALYQHPLTLVFSQLVLVIFSSFLVFKIAHLKLKSKFAALMFSLGFLFYPALGYIIAWTGFHGITVTIPFFLGAFYVFEKMHESQNISGRRLRLFWLLLVISLSGKEEVSLFVLVFGLFIWFRGYERLGKKVAIVALIWFIAAFFVIIPRNAHFRVEGYAEFARSTGLDAGNAVDVAKPNYFLSRYDDFGDSYFEVALNMVLNPNKVIREVLGGDKTENLNMTFAPLAYTSLLYPPVLVMAIPELFINYSTTSKGIGTSEIFNHRISLIIPLLFVSAIYGVEYVSRYLEKYAGQKKKQFIIFLSVVVLVANIQTSFSYQNPVYLWITQAIQKRIPLVFAQESSKPKEIGDREKLPSVEFKDIQCAQRVVNVIPDNASVSGPDNLGAHLSMRETYAIFPALHDTADYVIVDVFAQKVSRILDVDLSLVNEMVGKVVKNPEYKLVFSCGNLFVFKNTGPHGKPELLPIQERFTYLEKFSFDIAQSVHLVDFDLPEEFDRGVAEDIRYVLVKRGNDSLNGFILYTTFVEKESEEGYQFVSLPSFGLLQMSNWVSDHYYIENSSIVLPDFLNPGEYEIYIGITNKAKTRNVYLGDVDVK